MEGINRSITEGEMVARAKELLEELTHLTKIPIEYHPDSDAVLEADPWIFVLELKRQGSLPSIEKAISHVRRFSERFRREGKALVPLVVVPYMTELGAKKCEEAGCSWLD